jgi:GT2 family glycosyltransferase
MLPTVVSPAMLTSIAPDWSRSIWVGVIDISELTDAGLQLTHSTGYARARLLVRAGRVPSGFVEVDIHDGQIAAPALREAVAALPHAPAQAPVESLPAVSVVLCTRDRPEALRSAIASLLALTYPDFEIVIVDNAPATDASREVVAAISDSRLRLVTEPLPGLARARNCGVLAARHGIIAFTDDDVVVDPGWLLGLIAGFRTADDVACVCGMVPSGELRSFSQAYFDRRVTWARSCTTQLYRLSTPPTERSLFPFQVGQYGTGANFALQRSVVIALGGFDEALGVGSPTRGGEDIDMFVRVLLAGHGLVYEPSALVWHRHRADPAALHEQIAGYGLGLGAWIAKLLLDRRTAPMVMLRAGRGALHALHMTRVSLEPDADGTESSTKGLAATELWAVARGPLAYLRARLAGARRAPLKARARPGEIE